MTGIAITGNIAAGKSAVEKILMDKGFSVYDSDAIAHKILEELEEVKKFFPDCYNDRKKLGEIVFKNPEKRKLLENIIHPEVKKVIESIGDDLFFVSVPLLFEAGMENMFDKIILVYAPEKVRLKRLMSRNNLTVGEARLRINSQSGDKEKMEKSDFVIVNDSTYDKLEVQVNNVLAECNIFGAKD